MTRDDIAEVLQERLQRERADETLTRQAFAYARECLDRERDAPPFPDAAAISGLSAFDEPLPKGPTPASAVLEQLHRFGSPATVAHNGGRYFGFVNGGALPAAQLARLLGDIWDQNAALSLMSPVAAKLEAVCERWLIELLGLPDGAAMGLVGGTSTATLCGLLAGRDELLRRMGWDTRRRGLFGAPAIRVVMSEAAHASVRKALAILGIGADQIELVPADDQGRFDAARCPPLDGSALLLLQAGNVNSGAFDPLERLCLAAREAGAWTHIDGAFGLWARACRATKPLTEGMELADSWSVDAHKTLNAPYDCGLVFCRQRTALARALQAEASYLPLDGARDGMLTTPEMSRRARSVDLWATLKSLGERGVDQLVELLCRRASQFALELEAAGFRILNDVVFNQILAACHSPAATRRTLERVQASGECWMGGTEWRGEPAIRVSVCGWATTAEDLRRSMAALVDARADAGP